MNYVQIDASCLVLFYRRLAALLYDSLLILAILIFATLLFLNIYPHQATLTTTPFIKPGNIIYQIYLSSCWFLFVAWFWVHGGQSLGMLAWRLRCVNRSGAAISWSQALLRFIIALFSYGCLGLGFVWILIDKQKRTWHDICSGTQVILEKPNF